MQNLEAIVSQASSFDDFQKSPRLIDAYYVAATKYFGEGRFQRRVFDFILQQARDFAKETPEIAVRLWQPRQTWAPFSIETVAPTFGRELNKDEWSKFVGKWLNDLAAGAGRFLELPEDDRLEAIFAAIAPAHEKIKAFEKKNAKALRLESGDPENARHLRRERLAAQGRFFRTLYADQAMREAAHCFLYHHLNTPSGRNRLFCDDADYILNEIEYWRHYPDRIGSLASGTKIGPVLSLLRSLIPRRDKLLANEKIFVVKKYETATGKIQNVGHSLTTTYTFSPVARPFHAIWRGLVHGDCVGGNGTDLESNTPARWALPCLDGTECIYVAKNWTRYEGYIQLVPIQRQNLQFISIELQATILAKSILGPAKKAAHPLFRFCLNKLHESLPPRYNGFVTTASFRSHSAGCFDSLIRSHEYQFGEDVGPAEEFAPIDSFAETIAERAVRKNHAIRFAKGMIFDASIPNAGELRRLKPIQVWDRNG